MAWGLGLLATALGLNTIAGLVYTRRQIERSMATLQTEIATVTARHIQTYIARKFERLNDVASSMTLHAFGGSDQTLLAHLLVKNDPSFSEIAVLDDRGQERLKIAERRSYLAGDLSNQSHNDAYKAAMSGRNFISPVFTSDRAEPYVVLAVPLKSSPQKNVGVIVANTNLKFLWSVVREKKFNRAGYAYVVNGAGHLIAHEDSSLVLTRPSLINSAKIREFLQSRSLDRRPGALVTGISGEKVLSTYAPVWNLGWLVVVEEPVALALEDLNKLSWFTAILWAAGLVLGAAIIVWLSNRFTKPIVELRRSAEVIEGGNLNHRVNIYTHDEIGELGAKFNQMADALKTSYETLEEKVELRTREISTLYDVTSLVNQSLIIDTVLHDVIRKIMERFNFDTSRIFLFDSDFETLRMRASRDTAHGPASKTGPYRKGHSVVGRVAESGEAVFFEDVQTDPRYLKWSESKASQRSGLRFLAALPIKTKTRIFGAAAFSGSETRKLNDEELRLLNAMCEHVAVAVEKETLFEEVRKRSDDLAQANRELEEALTVKSEFISSMSHELRTPLNVIMGYAKMTGEGFFGAVNTEQLDALDKISRYSDVLLKMVNNVLNLSRVEAKKLSLDIGNVDPHELVAQVRAQVEPLNRNQNLSFAWEIESDVPQLISDPLKLEEILQNLIGNAIKFTPAGKIQLRVRNLAQQGKVEFSVADTGVGIEENDLGNIFNAFEQGKEAHIGNLDGVGLGLSIVKKYLDLMKGEIRVTSHVGLGSTFTFTIPHTVEESAPAAA